VVLQLRTGAHWRFSCPPPKWPIVHRCSATRKGRSPQGPDLFRCRKSSPFAHAEFRRDPAKKMPVSRRRRERGGGKTEKGSSICGEASCSNIRVDAFLVGGEPFFLRRSDCLGTDPLSEHGGRGTRDRVSLCNGGAARSPGGRARKVQGECSLPYCTAVCTRWN